MINKLKSLGFGIIITTIVVLLWEWSFLDLLIDESLFKLFFQPFLNGSEPIETWQFSIYLSLSIQNGIFIALGCCLCLLLPKPFFTNTLIVFVVLFISLIAALHIPTHNHPIFWYVVTLILWVSSVFLFWQVTRSLRSNKSLNQDATNVAPIS